jgi:hypothetical protein
MLLLSNAIIGNDTPRCAESKSAFAHERVFLMTALRVAGIIGNKLYVGY